MDWDLSCSLTVLQMEPAAGMELSVTHVDVDSPRDGTSVLSVVADSTIPRQAIEPLVDSMQAHDAIDAAPAIIETAAKPVEVDAAEPSGGLESAIHGVVAGSPEPVNVAGTVADAARGRVGQRAGPRDERRGLRAQ